MIRKSELRKLARKKWGNLAKWNHEQNVPENVRREQLMKEIHLAYIEDYRKSKSN